MKRNPSQPGLFDALEFPLLKEQAGPAQEAPPLDEADWKHWQGARWKAMPRSFAG